MEQISKSNIIDGLLKDASFSKFSSYYDKMMWDISNDMSTLMMKFDTKTYGFKVERASANAANTFSISITDLNGENYVSVWVNFEIKDYKIFLDADLNTTPRSSKNIKNRKKFFKENYGLVYTLDHVAADLSMAIEKIFEEATKN